MQISNLTKYYQSHRVLNDICLDIHAGQTIAVVGPSGGGKSTLCRTMVGLEPFDTGRISLDGQMLMECRAGRALSRGPEYRRRRLSMGMVFQHFTLFPQLTVRQNIALGPSKVLKLPADEVDRRVVEVLRKVGLSDKADAYPGHMSGGQQQRAAIARELAMDRRIVFFDEVTSALDPELVREVLDVMRDLAGTGMALVIVTHEMRFAKSAADRLIFVEAGTIVEDGHPSEIISNPSTPRLRAFFETIE